MVVYKCFNCDKKIKGDQIKKRVRCPFCGSKVLFKPRTVSSKVNAR